MFTLSDYGGSTFVHYQTFIGMYFEGDIVWMTRASYFNSEEEIEQIDQLCKIFGVEKQFQDDFVYVFCSFKRFLKMFPEKVYYLLFASNRDVRRIVSEYLRGEDSDLGYSV